jgi:hypothetical protein
VCSRSGVEELHQIKFGDFAPGELPAHVRPLALGRLKIRSEMLNSNSRSFAFIRGS